MENKYEEEYPTTVSYEKYERDIEEYEQRVKELQNEIYKKDRVKEALENFIESIKENYETLQADLKKEHEKKCS